MTGPLPASSDEIDPGVVLTYTEVPLLVNVLENVDLGEPGTGDDVEYVEEVVAEANKILKQAQIRLGFDSENAFKPNVSDQANNDGELSQAEMEGYKIAAMNELRQHTDQTHSGVKLVFVNELLDDADCVGAAAHNPYRPMVVLNPNLGTKEEQGNTLAHEFSHAMTLGDFHLISETDDGEIVADGTSHSNDLENLMYSGRSGPAGQRGTTLTGEQRREIRTKAKHRGVTRLGGLPLISIATDCLGCAQGGVQDATGADIAPGTVSDVLAASIVQTSTGDPFELAISFSGGLGPFEAVEFSAKFDTDDDTSTGATLTPPFGPAIPGVDRLASIFVQGDPGAGGSLGGVLLDDQFNVVSQLSCEFEAIALIVERDPPGSPTSDTIHDQIRCNLQPEDLSLSATSIPITLVATELFGAESPFDRNSMTLELDQPSLPAINLSACSLDPGDSFLVSGLNFFANASGAIQLDDEHIGSFSTDGSGSFVNVGVTIPAATVPDYYFVTASARDPVSSVETQFMFDVIDVGGNFGTCGAAVPSMDVGTWILLVLFLLAASVAVLVVYRERYTVG